MSKNKKWSDYVIPIPLSEYVETMEDWELVEYASRYKATSKYYRNGATEAKIKEVMRVWDKRYQGEDLIILECVPPLEYTSSGTINMFSNHSKEKDE
jgi:hypothetical protein